MNTRLIFDYHERQERVEQKKQALLSWLADFTWTTPELAGQVMGLNTRAGINKTLKRLQSQKLIKEAFIPLADNRALRIIGITANGLLWCDGVQNSVDKPCFDPGRVAQSTIIHKLDVQRCRLKLGKTALWIAENNYSKAITYRPDAIFESQGKRIALELERTAKTKKRYQQIIAQHLRQINNKEYASVHYVSTVPGFAPRLNRLFNSIEKLPHRGQQLLFNDDLRTHFEFYEFDEWRH